MFLKYIRCIFRILVSSTWLCYWVSPGVYSNSHLPGKPIYPSIYFVYTHSLQMPSNISGPPHSALPSNYPQAVQSLMSNLQLNTVIFSLQTVTGVPGLNHNAPSARASGLSNSTQGHNSYSQAIVQSIYYFIYQSCILMH